MAKQKKKKHTDKPHWQSFRDDLIPWVEKNLFVHFGKAIDYEKLRSHLGSCTGFGDFLSTDIGGFIYSGTLPGYAPMANELYSVALWDACGRIILRPSEGLLRLLMETNASIPISDVNPPFPSVFIELPKHLLKIQDSSTNAQVPATGMYVAWGDVGSVGKHSEHIDLSGGARFNDTNRQARALLIGPGDPRSEIKMHNWALRYQSLCWAEPCKESVDDLVDQHITDISSGLASDMEDAEMRARQLYASGTVWKNLPVDEFMLRIAANLFLYMSCPDADVLKNPSELHERLADFRKRKVSSTRRKRVKRQIHDGMVPSLTMDIGSSIVIRSGPLYESPDAPSEGGRKSPRPHWRKGHFRSVRFGEGRKEKRIKWIKPVLVRKDAAGGTTEVQAYEVRE